MAMTAFEMWISGTGSFTCLDDAVAHWHDQYEGDLSLSEYMGMNTEQFSLYIRGQTQFETVYPYGGEKVS